MRATPPPAAASAARPTLEVSSPAGPLVFVRGDAHILAHLDATCPYGPGHARSARDHALDRRWPTWWTTVPVPVPLDTPAGQSPWPHWAQVSAPRRRDARRYAGWLTTGKPAPAILLTLCPRGANPVPDGQHRVAAARLVDRPSIAAYLSFTPDMSVSEWARLSLEAQAAQVTAALSGLWPDASLV